MHTAAAPQPKQMGLLDTVTREVRPHKSQRSTARAVFHAHEASERAKASAGKETREGQVLRLLAAFWDARQVSPTALELLQWATYRGERLFDINSIRPRINALVAKGLVEPRAKRKCQVSGQVVRTWGVREIGSIEAR
jgi:hypothetical protein